MTRPRTMTDNRNTILAVVLSGLVLIGWQYFYNIPQMEKQRAAAGADAGRARQAGAAASAGSPAGSRHAAAGRAPSRRNAGRPARPPQRRSSAATPRSRPRRASRSRRPRLTGSISLKGARIDDLALEQIPRDRRSEIARRSCCSRRRAPPSPIMPNSAGSPAAGSTVEAARPRTRSGSRKAPAA